MNQTRPGQDTAAAAAAAPAAEHLLCRRFHSRQARYIALVYSANMQLCAMPSHAMSTFVTAARDLSSIRLHSCSCFSTP